MLKTGIVRDKKDKFGRPGKVVLMPEENIPNLLEMGDLPMLMEEESLKEKLKSPVPVRELSELPYYARNEQWVHQYYQNRKARKASQ